MSLALPLRTDSIAHQAAWLSGKSPVETLRWAAAEFGDGVAFATGFGAEGCVLVDIIGRHQIPIRMFALDTGVLFPETYELWRRLEAKYGVKIHAVHPKQSLHAQAEAHGERLWERDPDACCALRKVAPLREALSSLDAGITSIRRDQTPVRAHSEVVEHDHKFGLVKVNPLVTWTSADVWAHLKENDVPVNPLHEQGYPSIGCLPCTSPVQPGEDPRSGRWRGRVKTECGVHARPVTPTFLLQTKGA